MDVLSLARKMATVVPSGRYLVGASDSREEGSLGNNLDGEKDSFFCVSQ